MRLCHLQLQACPQQRLPRTVLQLPCKPGAGSGVAVLSKCASEIIWQKHLQDASCTPQTGVSCAPQRHPAVAALASGAASAFAFFAFKAVR
mmetsp:Transcript_20411/g.61477  ORF Transcript_20411/g.61477 Transcript_20411/m.61477 type:complete len:91 (+) Transcript_20411:3727-3999(+)